MVQTHATEQTLAFNTVYVHIEYLG